MNIKLAQLYKKKKKKRDNAMLPKTSDGSLKRMTGRKILHVKKLQPQS